MPSKLISSLILAFPPLRPRLGLVDGLLPSMSSAGCLNINFICSNFCSKNAVNLLCTNSKSLAFFKNFLKKIFIFLGPG